MKMRIREIAVAVMVLGTLIGVQASDLDALQGKWTAARTNQEGQVYSQAIEIEKDQLIFQIVDSDSKVRFFSKGTVKATSAVPFSILTINDIRAGHSQEDLQPVNDSRALVYTLRDGKLFLASNFDRERENEKPAAEIYIRKQTGEDDTKLLGKWKMDVMLNDNTFDYELRISKPGNQLEAVLVSPRSGEHKCKAVRFDKGEVIIEIDRQIEGNQLTFRYQGKLTSDGLSGNVQIKGQEDQGSGTWKASKR